MRLSALRDPVGAIRMLRRGELGGFAGDSLYVAVWQGSISVADLVQIALITHALGLTEYGRLSLVIAFVMLVSQFFDVRVGVATTTFGARRLERSPAAALGVFQLSYVIDFAAGVLGFLVVAALAPIVGPALVGDDGTSLVVLYALTLLASTVDESSISILRLLDRFRLIAAFTVALELGRIVLVAVALAVFDDLTGVVLALLVYELLAGGVSALAAATVFRRVSGGVSVLRPALREIGGETREMLRMVLHTNVVSYARLAQTQLPTIVVGAIAGATQAGLYKVGMAAAAILGRLGDPLYAALLPRISRLWAGARRDEVKRLIKRASLAFLPALALATVALVAFREPIVDVLGGEGAESAATVLVLGGLAQAANAALFWNIGVLFVADRSRAVATVAVAGAVVQAGLLSALVPSSEATGAAVAFLVSMVGTNALLGYLALRILRDPATSGDPEPALRASSP